MNILLDARRLRKNMGGVGIYASEIIKYFVKNGHFCHLLVRKNVDLPEFILNKKNINLIPFGTTIANNQTRFNEESNELSDLIIKIKPDLYHALDNTGIPSKCPVPSVLTIHDLIPLVLGEYMTKQDQTKYRKAIMSSAQNATAIISISEFTKKEIIKILGIEKNKISVIHNGLTISNQKVSSRDFKLFCLEKGVNKKYIIYVGGLGPRKNIDKLIEAFNKLKNHYNINKYQLIITGALKETIKNEIIKYNKLINSLGLEKDIVFTDFLEQKYLDALRKNAVMAIYPSLYEGFGLPVIEAMACKVPIVASNITSIPEVADKAALLCNPNSIDDISKKMRYLLTHKNLQKKLVERGIINAGRYSWQKTCEEIFEKYQHVLGGKNV